MLKKLKESYQKFKEKTNEAFDYFIYELTIGKGHQAYLENKADLARLIQREIALEYSITPKQKGLENTE